MPIPSTIDQLSQTAASNYPSGSDSPSTLDDTQRAHASFIALLRDGKGQTNQVTLASSTTTDIGGQNSQFVEVTGTTTITSFGSTYNGPRYVRFTGVLTLTHNSTALNLPTGANISTEAGDACIAVPNSSLNGWNVVNYQRASGAPVGSSAPDATTSVKGIVELATEAEAQAGSDTVRAVTPSGVKAAAQQIQPISASVAASALTISAGALSLDFRSSTLGSGTVTRVSGTPSNLVISSGSTLGTVSGQQSDIYVLAINNAGTIELAAVNIAGGLSLDETGLISTTAEGGAGAADSVTVIYSTTARTNVAYRVIGLIRSTQTTAGTWATAPSLVQGAGGNALDALGSLGYGQTWQDVSGSRVLATTYYNTTGKPISAHVSVSSASTSTITPTVAGANLSSSTIVAGGVTAVTIVIPPGASYAVSGGTSIASWRELR